MGPPAPRGRGASGNPPNRFLPIATEREEWTDPGDPGPDTLLLRDESRSVISRNRSPDVGFETSLNPYRGCEHGCIYCLGGETPILLDDGSVRRLEALRVGDMVYGTVRVGRYRRYVRTPVLAHWRFQRSAYRITLHDGTTLVAGGDHRFLTWRGWKFVTGAEQGRLRRPHLTINDRLLGIGRLASSPGGGPDYMRGYLCGVIRGDGALASYYGPSRRPGGQHHFRLAMVDRDALVRAARYLLEFGVATGASLFQDETTTRKAVYAIRNHSRAGVERIRELVAFPERTVEEWERGFLAGIYDAEGSYSGGILRIFNTDPEIIRRTTDSLGKLGFRCRLEDRSSGGRLRPLKVVRLLEGLKEHLRFFHSVTPAIARKRDFEGQAVKSAADLRVAAIEPLGFTLPLYDITTGTGDFIANGVVSHNCYARPTHEYFGLSAGLDFETRIFAKERAAERLRAELCSPRWKPQTLVLSGVTDPYQPAERRLRITRRCLEVLAEFRNPVAVVTKSDLVARDADLLADLAGERAAAVTLSITTLDPALARALEPRAATPARRLAAIRRLAGVGVPVGVNVAPVIPGLTDHELPAILAAAAEAGATSAGWILLRLPHGVAGLFEEWLERHVPERRDRVLALVRGARGGRLNDSRFGSRMRGEGEYAAQLARLFRVSCRRAGLSTARPALSAAAFRVPTSRVDARGSGRDGALRRAGRAAPQLDIFR